MHKAPLAASGTGSSTSGPVSTFLLELALKSIATDALDQWDQLKQSESTIMLPPPSLPASELSSILFSRYPLSFSNFLRVQPLPQQKQYAHEIQTLPPHLIDLTAFSTKLPDCPGLSLAYQAYLDYRRIFSAVQRPHLFTLNQQSTEFLSTYNWPETTGAQFIRNSKELGERVRLKVSLSQLQNYINSFHTTAPAWAVVSHLPLDVTAQSIIALMSRQGGYQDCILLPHEPSTLTKIAFVAFDSVSSRNSACTVLNGSLSPHPNEANQGSDQSQGSGAGSASASAGSSSSSSKASAAQYRLHISPWISSSQFDTDSSHTSIAKPMHHRQPVAPIGFKQWITGPIPLSTLNHRLDKDTANALLMGRFLDYIRLIPVESNLDHLLDHLNRYLGSAAALAASTAPAGGPGAGSTTAQTAMLKFKFILHYLRQVHFFDYFTTTLYPSKEALNVDIGNEWILLDPPQVTSALAKHYAANFSASTFTAYPLPLESKQRKLYDQQQQQQQQQHNHAATSANKTAELALEQSTLVTTSLRQIPFDQALAPHQLALTAYYNAILAVSPPSTHTTGFATQTPNVVVNFWNIQHFYQQLFYPDYAVASLGPAGGLVAAEDAGELPNTIFTSPESAATSASTTAVPTQQPRYPSTTPDFWDNIDSAAGQISAMFDPDQIDRTTTPTVDMMDPDLFYLPKLFSAPALTTSLSQLMQHNASLMAGAASSSTPRALALAAPVAPAVLRLPPHYAAILLTTQLTQFYKQAAPNRFRCLLCPKVMISQITILKHILTQHNHSALPGQDHSSVASSSTNATIADFISAGAKSSKPKTKADPRASAAAAASAAEAERANSIGGGDTVAAARMRLLQNTIYLRFLFDQNAAALNPPVLSSPHLGFVTKNLNPHLNHKNQFTMFSPRYRVHEILTYKRHALATLSIDRSWEAILQQARGHVAADAKRKQLKMTAESTAMSEVDTASQPGHQRPRRNLRLEAEAERHRQKMGATQLFKGFDGDAYGTGRAVPKQLNYLAGVDGLDNNDDEAIRRQSNHILYTQVQALIDSDPTLAAEEDGEIKPHHIQPVRLDFNDLPGLDFALPSFYGLEPFAGQ